MLRVSGPAFDLPASPEGSTSRRATGKCTAASPATPLCQHISIILSLANTDVVLDFDLDVKQFTIDD